MKEQNLNLLKEILEMEYELSDFDKQVTKLEKTISGKNYENYDLRKLWEKAKNEVKNEEKKLEKLIIKENKMNQYTDDLKKINGLIKCLEQSVKELNNVLEADSTGFTLLKNNTYLNILNLCEEIQEKVKSDIEMLRLIYSREKFIQVLAKFMHHEINCAYSNKDSQEYRVWKSLGDSERFGIPIDFSSFYNSSEDDIAIWLSKFKHPWDVLYCIQEFYNVDIVEEDLTGAVLCIKPDGFKISGK